MSKYPPQRPKFCMSEEVLVLIVKQETFGPDWSEWVRDFIVGIQWATNEALWGASEPYTGWIYKRVGGQRNLMYTEEGLQKLPENQRTSWKSQGNVWRPADLDMSC